MKRGVALALAIGLDAACGDPPNAYHPVAWLGRAARTIESVSPRTRAGGATAVASVLAVALASSSLAARWWPPLAGGRIGGEAALVWACTGWRSLTRHATEVADALDRDDLDEARRLLSFHLVSRDTSTLTASEVAGATIESVAENLSDGVIAPWCWYAATGVPGVVIYRALNTLDGMWGYRTPEYEAFGSVAARADDVMNLVPARLTASALMAAAAATGDDPRGALAAWATDRGQTASPNAGHPMAAMAGALGVTLAKRGEYALAAGHRAPTTADIRRAVHLADTTAWLAAAVLVACAAVGGRR